MIQYVDPIPPVLRFLNTYLEPRVVGNTFPSNVPLPALLVRSAGGTDYTRLQIVARSNSDIEAMKICIDAMNILEQHSTEIDGLNVTWINRETLPIAAVDDDSGKPEAWCYMRMEHTEA